MAPTDSAKSRWWHEPGTQRFLRAAAAAVPVAMVNSTAFIGQFAFIRTHVPWILPGQVLVALTFESVAVYLAWHAHIAQMANDSASRLKMGAYSFALIMGSMNYSHYAAHWRPTVLAVGMALMSALSPWLWGIHSRRASRDKLMAQGLIEKHAVRLGATRWTWHLIRSWRVMYWATWHGVNDPKRAIARFADKYPVGGTLEQELATLERAIDEVNEDVPSPAAVPVQAAPAVAPPPVPAARVFGTHWLAPGPDGTDVVVSVPHAPVFPAPVAQGIVNGPLSPPDQPRIRPLPPPPLDEEAGAGNHPDVTHGTAHLEADANLSGGRPPQHVIDNTELALAAMPLDEVNKTSIRWVARELLGDGNQRRLAKHLLDARKRAGTSLAEAPPSEAIQGNGAHPVRRLAPGMIAPPNAFQPGGNQ